MKSLPAVRTAATEALGNPLRVFLTAMACFFAVAASVMALSFS
jgi:hypothetical protein